MKRLKYTNTVLKTLVMTAARTITEKNGHRSQPTVSAEHRNIARKNHNFNRLVEFFMEGRVSKMDGSVYGCQPWFSGQTLSKKCQSPETHEMPLVFRGRYQY
jgi:hypothetical protein